MDVSMYRPLYDVSAGNDWVAVNDGCPSEIEAFNSQINNARMPSMPPMMSLSSLLSADLVESESDIKMIVDMPGVNPKDVKMTLTGNMLMLEAERKHKKEFTNDKVHCAERSYGMIQRSIRVPDGVNMDRAKTNFEHGVLTVTFPKFETAEVPKRRKLRGGAIKGDVKSGGGGPAPPLIAPPAPSDFQMSTMAAAEHSEGNNRTGLNMPQEFARLA